MPQKKSRILRFAVTGALLVGAPALACGGPESPHTNEPAPPHTNEPMVNEPAGGGVGDDGMGDDGMGDDGMGDDGMGEGPHVNEVAPE
jgi:hypothetical protein